MRILLQKKQQNFFTIWAQKEAFIKAVGEGLHYPLDKFVVPAVSNKPFVIDCKKQKWHLFNLKIDQAGAAICCFDKPDIIRHYSYHQHL